MEDYQAEIAKLESQLAEVVAAESFFESKAGRLFVDLANKKINTILKDITSDKYLEDHQGYVNAISQLNAYKTLLDMMGVAKSPKRRQKLEERLEGYSGVRNK